jgi:glyoxylate/hydroxypyruvate reductase A
MPIHVYFAGGAKRWPKYEAALRRAFAEAGLDVALSPEAPDPALVDYLIYAPGGPVTDFSPYSRLRAVQGLWAGVERIVGNPTLRVPLCRMVDPALAESMVEWMTAQVLRHHLGLDRFILPREPDWTQPLPPLARERPVTILGLGELGRAVGQALAALRFPVTGWSRSPQEVPGLRCLHGAAGLEEALAEAQVLVLLLPLTPQTENILDARRLALLPEGAFVINAGRGALIDDAALLSALDAGYVAHATLDVFRVEPLPADHPYWRHPRVTVSPHVAAETRAETSAPIIAENIRRDQAGLPMRFVVDRTRGY